MKRVVSILALLSLSACDQLPESLSSMPKFNFELPELSQASEPTQQNDGVDTPIVEVDTHGLKAWVVEDDSLPLVSVRLTFEGAGHSSDPENKQGRAMFAASLLDEGAGNLKSLQFQQALKDKAIQLSINTNQDLLVVQLRCLSEHLPEAMRLVGLALTEPRFDNTDIKRKRALAISTYQQAKSRPDFILKKTLNELAYDGHPYSAPPLADETSLNRITRTDLLNYTAQALTKERLFISAAGDVRAEKFEKLLEENLAKLPDASMLPTPPRTEIAKQNHIEIAEVDIPQSMVVMTTPAVDRKDELFFAAYVLNHIIGGDTLTSILGTAIREQKGLAYSVHSYLQPMSHASTFNVRFATRNEQVHEAFDTLKNELTDFAARGVDEASFQSALDHITGSFVLSLDNNTNYTRYLNTMQRFDLGKDYLATRNAKMRGVTREQINQLAKEWFIPERWLVVVAGKPDKLLTGNISSDAN